MNIKEQLANLQPIPSSYLKAARDIEADTALKRRTVKVAVVSTFTVELLRPYLVVECARRGFRAQLHFAPFNQLEQQLLDPASPLHAFSPDVIVIATRLEETESALITRFASLSQAEIESAIDRVKTRIGGLVTGTRRVSPARLLVFNFAPPAILSTGLADNALAISQTAAVQRLNELLAALCKETADTHVFDYSRMVSEFGLQRWHDPKLFYLGRVPFTVEAQIQIAKSLARYIRALFIPPCKCLVLDLDNTLWGGVLGEEGIGGIELGEEFPGRAYKDFQRYLLSLRDRGILLAIASKNNEADVMELFERHSDCVLRMEHFAARQINWLEKSESLKQIAKTLNIGTDALAFFDDNPAERELVRQRLPDVAVIDAPESAVDFIAAVHNSGAFDQLTISSEDQQRGAVYAEQQKREALKEQCVSTEDFLKSLDMSVTIDSVNSETLERVAQLLAKTNQFNLTTRRHSAAQINQMIDSGAIALWIRVKDRFGDNGLVGAAIALPPGAQSGEWFIDTFLLSCRVIGRKVETALLSQLTDRIRERGGRFVRGQFFPTAKNGLVSQFYLEHGFSENGDGWKIDLSQTKVSFPEFISVTSGESAGKSA